jgi:23S rRNA (cytosine1962-C5)-methyltransferase
LKLRPKGGVKAGQVRQEIVGATPPEKLIVREHPLGGGDGFAYEVHPLGGLNVGLFTDMREHRRGLARWVRGKRVLNTFAYTGALSVAAAMYGAKEVTSVDLSSGVLKWAAENFRLNGLDPAAHRFETADVMRFLEKAHKAGERWDIVILDPPTYSAARARAWSAARDMPSLIARGAAVLEPPGLLWVSSNTHGSAGLAGPLAEGLHRSQRRSRILETGSLPADYPTAPQDRDARYLEHCLIWNAL